MIAMNTFVIEHRVGIQASLDKFFSAMTDPARAQWSESTEAESKMGNVVRVRSGNQGCGEIAAGPLGGDFALVVAVSDRKIRPPQKRLAKAKVPTNGRRLKSLSIYRRMRSRPSFSFGTRAGKKVRTFRVIAP